MSVNGSEAEWDDAEGSLRDLQRPPQLSTFLGQYVLLIFQSSEWNPARSEILGHYRQSLSFLSGNAAHPGNAEIELISGLETDEDLAQERLLLGARERFRPENNARYDVELFMQRHNPSIGS